MTNGSTRPSPDMNAKPSLIARGWPHLILLPVCAVLMMPIAWLIIAAFKTNADFFATLFFPVDANGVLDLGRLTTASFGRLFGRESFHRAFFNSVFLSSALAAIGTLGAAAGGYALARLRFHGSTPVTILVLGLLVIPPPLLLAPTYELMHNLGLLDNYLAVILPGLAPAFAVFLFRQSTMQSVPKELIEASRIDGLGEIGIFANVALPLLRPMIGAMMLVMFLGMWNNFIGPQVFLHSPEKMPLAVAVANLKGTYYTEYGLQMAATLLAVAPVLILFLLLQRDFVSGLASGAVKG